MPFLDRRLRWYARNVNLQKKHWDSRASGHRLLQLYFLCSILKLGALLYSFAKFGTRKEDNYQDEGDQKPVQARNSISAEASIIASQAIMDVLNVS